MQNERIRHEITREQFWRNRDKGVEFEVTRCPCGAKFMIKRTTPFVQYQDQFADPTKLEFSQFVCPVCETNKLALQLNMEITDIF